MTMTLVKVRQPQKETPFCTVHPMIFMVCLLNFFLQIRLTISGLSDYFHLVYISQFIIAAALVIAVVIVFRAIRQLKIKPTLMRSVGWGLCACILDAGIGMM